MHARPVHPLHIPAATWPVVDKPMSRVRSFDRPRSDEPLDALDFEERHDTVFRRCARMLEREEPNGIDIKRKREKERETYIYLGREIRE